MAKRVTHYGRCDVERSDQLVRPEYVDSPVGTDLIGLPLRSVNCGSFGTIGLALSSGRNCQERWTVTVFGLDSQSL